MGKGATQSAQWQEVGLYKVDHAPARGRGHFVVQGGQSRSLSIPEVFLPLYEMLFL